MEVNIFRILATLCGSLDQWYDIDQVMTKRSTS